MKKQPFLLAILLMVCGSYSGTNWAHGEGGHGGGRGYYGHGGYGYGGGYPHHWGYGYRGGYPRYWGYGYGGYYGYPGFSFYFGAPYYGYPFYNYPFYGYPYYYPPGFVTAPSTPPVYIQQKPLTAQQYPSGYWYYCTDPQGYYPDIKECPNGWQQVQPAPPPMR